MPRSVIRSASEWIISGSFTDACFGKLSEPSVSDASSGFTSPSRSSTSARSSKLLNVRPLVETQTIASGQRSRIAAMIFA